MKGRKGGGQSPPDSTSGARRLRISGSRREAKRAARKGRCSGPRSSAIIQDENRLRKQEEQPDPRTVDLWVLRRKENRKKKGTRKASESHSFTGSKEGVKPGLLRLTRRSGREGDEGSKISRAAACWFKKMRRRGH